MDVLQLYGGLTGWQWDRRLRSYALHTLGWSQFYRLAAIILRSYELYSLTALFSWWTAAVAILNFLPIKPIYLYINVWVCVCRWGPISFRKARCCKMWIRTKIYWLNDGGANSTKLLKYSRTHSSLTHSHPCTMHAANYLFRSETPNDSRALNIPECRDWRNSHSRKTSFVNCFSWIQQAWDFIKTQIESIRSILPVLGVNSVRLNAFTAIHKFNRRK